MSTIEHVIGREVLDSRGNPTVEAEVLLDSGARGRAIAPSGASTGIREAVELRDGGERFSRQGRAAAPWPTSTARSPTPSAGSTRSTSARVDFTMIDLDGTPDKGRLGANAILAVSLANAKALADDLEIPLYRSIGGANAHVLPVPMFNVLNGGAHADNSIDFQEFMVMPVGAASFSEALRWGAETYHALRASWPSAGCRPPWATREGSRPTCPHNEDAVKLLLEAIERGRPRARGGDRARPRPGHQRAVGRRLLRPGRRGTDAVAPPSWSTTGWTWSTATRSCSIEDGMAEEDWDGWARHTEALGRADPAGGRRHLRHQRRRSSSGGSARAWRTPSSSSSTRSAP